ncbi:15356_t:CDS:2, partial [Gigaspora rosea]
LQRLSIDEDENNLVNEKQVVIIDHKYLKNKNWYLVQWTDGNCNSRAGKQHEENEKKKIDPRMMAFFECIMLQIGKGVERHTHPIVWRNQK